MLREGTDVTLAACGSMVSRALDAAELLEQEGVSAEVIDFFSLKPIDVGKLLASSGKTGAVVTCEEHSVIAGFGSAVAVYLGEHAPCPMERVGVRDVFGTSGDIEPLMKYFGLTAPDIAGAARRVIARKG